MKLTGVTGGGGVVYFPELLGFDSGRFVVVATFVCCFGLLDPMAFLVGTPLLRVAIRFSF